MPGGNRTGPLGYGPMTGRRMGYCSGYQEPGYWHPGPGLGYGRSRGLGFGRGMASGLGLGRTRGWRHFGRFRGYPMPYAPPYAFQEGAQMAPEREIDHLKEEDDFLKEELNRIEQIITELKGEKE